MNEITTPEKQPQTKLMASTLTDTKRFNSKPVELTSVKFQTRKAQSKEKKTTHVNSKTKRKRDIT